METMQRKDLPGSVKMIRDRWSRPLGPGDVDAIIDVLDRHDLQVRDVLCVGTPDPEWITGRVTSRPDVLGPLTKDLLALEATRVHDLEVLPNGIPFPEWLDINFKIGR